MGTPDPIARALQAVELNWSAADAVTPVAVNQFMLQVVPLSQASIPAEIVLTLGHFSPPTQLSTASPAEIADKVRSVPIPVVGRFTISAARISEVADLFKRLELAIAEAITTQEEESESEQAASS